MDSFESELRAGTRVFINSFNQPTYLENMVSTLQSNGFQRISICDNASQSEKTIGLLARLEAGSGVEVRRLGANIGPRAAFQKVAAGQKKPFIFTDPDLALSPVLPDDFLTTLLSLSEKYRCRKVGLALRIPPPEECAEIFLRTKDLGDLRVWEWENRFWEHVLEEGVYRADVDTTFFLWNPSIRVDYRRVRRRVLDLLWIRRHVLQHEEDSYTDIRVGKTGFAVDHMPWLKDDGFPEDEKAFYAHEAARWSTWLRREDAAERVRGS